MTRLMTFLAAAVFAIAATTSIQAQCYACDSGCAACAAPTCCNSPACQTAGRCCGGPRCVGTAEMVDVEKHCWNIECEEICVPAVRFPWEHGGNKLTLFSLFKFKCDKDRNNLGCSDRACDGGCAAAPSCECSGGGNAGLNSGCAGSGCATCVPPKHGFVVTVREPKKKTYDAQVCEYSISLADNGGGCDNCTAPGCAAGATASADEIAPAMEAPAYDLGPSASKGLSAARLPSNAPDAPTAKSRSFGKLKFISWKSRLFGNGTNK